jgi:trans-o-hydroxybenzylidenepyruvate hydratase-aldolase
MLTASDLRGLTVMVPTPCKAGADGWDAVDSVDLEETARMTEQLISAGVGAIAACGTTGEAAALLWEEKRDFVDTMVQATRKRVPIFAGATALGTKEVVRQMRALRDVGADAAFVGLPLWQTPTLENSVQWYADLGEAVPDLPIMVYANAMFFKSTFPTVFWEGIARKAPTVITAKVSYGIEHLREDLEVAGHQVAFQPGQREIFPAYQIVGTRITAAWSTSAAMGPEPMVALMDAILRDDARRAEEIWEDISSLPPQSPPGEHALHFPEYNAQHNRAFTNAAGYIKAGPSRAPYRDLPEHWRQQAELHGKAWATLRSKYVRTGRTPQG